MKVEINDKRIKCKLLEIRKGECFLSPKNEICIKTNEHELKPWFNDDEVFCCIDDIEYFVCVNLMNGELLNIPPIADVIPLNLKVVEK